MTQNIIERVQRATKLDQVVLAFPYTDTDADTTFADLAVRCGCSYYRGTGVDENDLVGRYLAAATCYGADIIVRIPGDNPCVEPEYVDMAVKLALSEPVPFYTNTTAGFREHFIDGIGAEVYTFSTLRWLDEFSNEREHPHKYFDRYFEYRLPSADLRLDVNGSKDYEFIKMIYDHFGHNRFTIEEVLGYLDSKRVSVG